MNKYKNFFAIIILFLSSVLIFTACINIGDNLITPSGSIISDTYDFGSFSGVDIGGVFEIHYSYSSNYSIRISMHENLFANLDISNNNGILEINLNNVNFSNANIPILHINAPTLSSIDISGAATFHAMSPIENNHLSIMMSDAAEILQLELNVEDFYMTLSGAAEASLTGNASDVNISSSGSADVHALNLHTNNANISSSGASTVNITVLDSLNVHSSGTSTVNFRGDASVNSHATGSSSVNNIN